MSNLDFNAQNYIQDGVTVNKSLVEENLSKRKDNLFFLAVSAIALVFMFVILILNTFVFFIADVDGSSMYPTLRHGDKLLTNCCATPKVDSIVTIRQKNSQTGEYELWIKRVIAFGGDTVEIKDGSVYVNGELKAEPYVEQGVKTESIKGEINYGYQSVVWQLEEDEVFFMGDNRQHLGSTDARVVGPCKRSDIVSVVMDWTLWH